MIDMLISTAEMAGVLCAVAGLAMTCRRGRRLAFALARYGRRHMSPWMLAVVAVCAAIPGPLDEIVVFPILAAITLRTPRNRVILARYVRTALR